MEVPPVNSLLLALPGEGELNLSAADGPGGDWGISDDKQNNIITLIYPLLKNMTTEIIAYKVLSDSINLWPCLSKLINLGALQHKQCYNSITHQTTPKILQQNIT